MASRFSGNRGISSIGRAPASHAEGTGFDAQILQVIPANFVFSLGKDPILAIACWLVHHIQLGAVAQLVRAPV